MRLRKGNILCTDFVCEACYCKLTPAAPNTAIDNTSLPGPPTSQTLANVVRLDGLAFTFVPMPAGRRVGGTSDSTGMFTM